MPTESIEALVDGGEASAGPPLGPQLGPLGVDIMEIVNAINERTEKFKGMKVPIELTVDTESGEYEIEVGKPPTSALLLEKLDIEKGSGNPLSHKAEDISIEQVKEIAEMKEDDLLGKNIKMKAKEIVGTCVSMGITVEGEDARDVQEMLDEGEFDEYF